MKALWNSSADIPQEMTLGNLMFMNIVDMKVTRDEFRDAFKANGVPESFVRDISPADAFRRASSSVAGKFGNYKIEVDEVRSDSQGIKKVIGVKEANNVLDTMEYEPAVELFFNRDTQTASYLLLKQDPVFDAMGQKVVDTFNDWTIYHTKDTVRNTIKRIVDFMHPVNLMPTGLCKFIPKTHTQLLEGLKGALNQLSQYSTSVHAENVCEIIPVFDTNDQRKVIQECCGNEIQEEISSLVFTLKDDLTKKQQLSTRSMQSYIEKFKDLEKKAGEYEGLLDTYFTVARAQLQEALKLVAAP